MIVAGGVFQVERQHAEGCLRVPGSKPIRISVYLGIGPDHFIWAPVGVQVELAFLPLGLALLVAAIVVLAAGPLTFQH